MQINFKKVLTVCVSVLMISSVFLGCANKSSLSADKKVISNQEVNLELAKSSGVNKYSASYTHDEKTEFFGTDGEKSSNEVYEAGSIGKVVTAYICLRLADEGKLDLDAPITDYLQEPWITDDARFKKITPRMLLTHTAGFSPSFETGIDKKIYFEPGSKFSYSGVGYIYLQNIIEAASGESFEKAASEYVFTPLGMTNSTFLNAATVTPFVNASTLAEYILLPWVGVSVAVFLIGALIGLLFKKRLYKSYKWVLISAAIGFIVELILIILILPRLLTTCLIVALIGTLAVFILRRKSKLRLFVLPSYFLLLIVFSFIFNVGLPVGPQFIDKGANAAYSFKTTASDMTALSQKLIEVYKSADSTEVKDMFKEAVKIDDKNAWSEGLGIEQSDGQTTYWHSGINPGMQSLVVICPEKDSACVIFTNSDSGLDFAKKAANDLMKANFKWDIVRTKLN